MGGQIPQSHLYCVFVGFADQQIAMHNECNKCVVA